MPQTPTAEMNHRGTGWGRLSMRGAVSDPCPKSGARAHVQHHWRAQLPAAGMQGGGRGAPSCSICPMHIPPGPLWERSLGSGQPLLQPGQWHELHSGGTWTKAPTVPKHGFGKVHPQGRGRRCPAPGLGAAQHGCKQHLFPEQGVFKDERRRSWEGWFYGIDGESVATWKMLITPRYLAPRPWHSLSDCPLSHGRSGITSSLLPSSPGRDGPGCAPSCPAGLGPRPGKVLKDRGRGHAQPCTSCHRRSRRTWPFPIRELSGEAAPGTGRVVHPFGRPGN